MQLNIFSTDVKSHDVLYKAEFQHHSTIISKVTLALLTVLTTSVAIGAKVEPAEYSNLLKQANETGVVRVLVSLDDTQGKLSFCINRLY